MNVYSVTVGGDHATLASERFFGIADGPRKAMALAELAADAAGWKNVRVAELTWQGTVAFDARDEKKAPGAFSHREVRS